MHPIPSDTRNLPLATPPAPLVLVGLLAAALLGSGQVARNPTLLKAPDETVAPALTSPSQPGQVAGTVYAPLRLSVPQVKVAPLPAGFSATLPSATRRAPYEPLILQAARKHQVDPDLIRAVITAESAYRVKVTSHAGAGGLMQLMPATGRQYGARNIYDPAQNIDAGTKYLRFLLDKFDNVAPLAIAAYNAGEGAVMKYHYTIPRYKETMQYVPKVLAYYALYKEDPA